MGEIEAVYAGILRQTGYVSHEEIAEQNRKYHDVTEVVAQAVAKEMRTDREAFEEETWQSMKQGAGIIGKLVMTLPRRRKKFAYLHDRVEVMLYSNPARASIHPLLDTICDLAEQSESGRVRYAPDDLVQKCLESNHTEHFVEDSGIEADHMPRVLQVTARTLAATAFRLSRQRSINPDHIGAPLDDYKAFELYSRSETS